jgi:hypothetical protein
MKSIRKIAGKLTALAVAITTSVALLSPYDASANSGSTNAGGGVGEKCFGRNYIRSACGTKPGPNGNLITCYVMNAYCPRGTNTSSCAEAYCNNSCGLTIQPTQNCN